jgi:hypothetical protein
VGPLGRGRAGEHQLNLDARRGSPGGSDDYHDPGMPPERITLTDRYVLQSPIASGGMATVWRARDEVLARAVAIKVLHPHLASDEDFLARFRREALAAARLGHPHIVAIYDTGRETGSDGTDRPFIVMEHCSRGSLADALAHSGALGPGVAVRAGITICDALAYAHAAGIVHRDIKPANVLVCEDGSLKVADFGIAKAAFAEADITTTGVILGTVTYLSPEQVEGLEPDQRSDIYSLGVVLYELVAGRPPFRAEGPLALALKHQREAPPPLRSVRVGVPRHLDAIVMQALAKRPEDRFASAEEMRAALERVRADDDARTAPFRAVATQDPRPEPQEANDARPPRLVPILAAVALAVALAFLVPALLLDEDAGGRGPSPSPPTPGGAGTAELGVRTVEDFDPYGGDGEHPEEVGLAIDGDPATAWRTSTYEDSLEVVKPGVGLLLDLGRARAVERVEVVSPSPGLSFELRAGSQPPDNEAALELVEDVARASGSSRVDLQGVRARYWLVWITSLPGGGGGSAQVSEVRFFGA